jgi:hypothetical protein
MPRFYFDVREGRTFTKDSKGIVYKDVAQAEREACITAAEIGRDALPKGHVRDVTVEVSDQHRQRIISPSHGRGPGDTGAFRPLSLRVHSRR